MFWVFLAATAWAFETPDSVPDPRPGGWIVDQAQILDASEEAALNARLERLEQDTTVELMVVTIAQTDRVPKDYATALFNRLEIGKEGANNGVLVLMVMNQRRLEMEVGYGLSRLLPDAWLGVMQAEEMVPAFKAGDFGTGIVDGVVATEAELRTYALEARVGSKAAGAAVPPFPDRPSRVWGDYAHESDDSVMLLRLGLPGLLLGLAFVSILVRRGRVCSACGVYMPALSEAEEDVHLDAGQQKEEEIGSANWTVRCCPTCEAVRITSSSRMWSSYVACPRCDYRTCTTTRTTLTAATQYSTGTAQVAHSCQQCGHRDTTTVVLPMLPKPSSSSSSDSSWSSSSSSTSSSRSSSSYGGGRSGGGGAGSSW